MDNTQAQSAVELDQVAPAAPAVVIPEHLQPLVDEILEYTKVAFNVPFEFTIQNGAVEGSVFLLGPYGTFVIALGVATTNEPNAERINAISVSLEAETHFAAVTTHSYAVKFGLVYMDPHCPSATDDGQVVFGPDAYRHKGLIDEARLRAKVVELAGEAARQASADAQPTLAERMQLGKKGLVDAHGRPMKA